MVGCIQWTWVWPNSRSWWWTGKPGVLQSLGSQRVGHDWATELKRSLVNFFNKQPNQFKKYQRVFLYRKKKSCVLKSYINLKYFLIIKCKTARISEPLLSQPQPQQNMKMYITHKKLNEWAMGEHIFWKSVWWFLQKVKHNTVIRPNNSTPKQEKQSTQRTCKYSEQHYSNTPPPPKTQQ